MSDRAISHTPETVSFGMFIIEDELHAEPQGKFVSFEQALAELKRRVQIPWDQKPNRAPCANWEACGRTYEIIEYDDSHLPWVEIRRMTALDISASGIKWSSGFGDDE